MIARMPQDVMPIIQQVKLNQGFTTNKQTIQYIVMKFAEHEAKCPSPTPSSALQLISTRQLMPSPAGGLDGHPTAMNTPTDDGPAFVEKELT